MQQCTIEKEIQFSAIKNELLETEGYRIRSKAQHIEFNERGSNFFINLEKRNANLKSITRLKLDNIDEVTESSCILNKFSNFYKKL